MDKKEISYSAPSVLLQTDKRTYYHESDIPCMYMDMGIKHFIGEEFGGFRIHEKKNRVGLIVNTIPICLRYEPYYKEESTLRAAHGYDNSWFVWNNPPKGRDYDSRCKKIAWGIAAYIGFHCWIGDDGELDWKHGTIEDLYKAYHDEAISILKHMSHDYCKAERHNDMATMQRISNEVEELHRQQEATYIEQSYKIGAILGEPILEVAKGYIEWLQELDKPQLLQDGAEPQQEERKQAMAEIPTIDDTDKEKFVFGNAMKKEYMSLSGS